MKSQPPRRSGNLKTIDSLTDDIYSLFDGKIDHIDVGVSHEADIEGSTPNLRMSNLGRPLRQLYYDLTNAPNQERLLGKTRFKFTYGHVLEDLVLALAEQAGHSVTDRQREVQVSNVKGHIDAIVDDVLVDVKSCSPYSFDKFKSGTLAKSDSFGYITQLASYWACVETERAGFLAINKVSGELFFSELSKKYRRSVDEISSQIKLVRDAVSLGVEPEKCYAPVADGKSGNLKLSVPCSYCSHRFHCWRDANNGAGIKTYFYYNGPRYLVSVVKEPKVPTEDVPLDIFPTKEE